MYEIRFYDAPRGMGKFWQLYATYSNRDGARACFERCVEINPETPWKIVMNDPVTIAEHQP